MVAKTLGLFAQKVFMPSLAKGLTKGPRKGSKIFSHYEYGPGLKVGKGKKYQAEDLEIVQKVNPATKKKV